MTAIGRSSCRRRRQRSEALCPSFDHAASLGFTLTEEARAQHLHDGTFRVGRTADMRTGSSIAPGTRWQTLVDLAESAI